MKKSKIKLDKVLRSDIKIKISKKEKKKQKEQLQRSEKWKEERRGRWTGVGMKLITSCAQGKGSLSWDNVDKLFSFGLTSVKYIYENAMERKTGNYIDEGEGTYQMRYGTRVEPLIQKETKRLLKEMNIKGKLKNVGFKTFSKMPNCGVSSDSILINKKGKTIASVEMKACTNWGTHYDRTFSTTDDKSKDFWQIQGQIIAHEVKLCYYATAQPTKDIKKYLFYDGDIMDLYDEFKKECKVTVEIVKKSKLHCKTLLKRIMIAEDTLNDWLSIGGSLKECLDSTIKMYEDKPKKFKNYIPPLPFQKRKKDKKTKQVLKKLDKKKLSPTNTNFLKEKKKIEKPKNKS